MADQKQTPIVRIGGRPGGGRGGPGGRFQSVREKPKDGKETLRRLVKTFSSEMGLICGLMAVVIVGCICSVAAPSFQSSAIDRISEGAYDRLGMYLAMMLATYLLYGGSTLLQGRISARLSQRIVKKLRSQLFDKTVDLPLQYLDNHPHGDIMSRMTNDIENVSNIIAQSLSSLVSGILTILGTFYMMMWYCWQLALLSCTSVVLSVTITKIISKAIRNLFRKRQILLGQLNSMVEEKVTAYRTVAAYNQQEQSVQAFETVSDQLRKTGIKSECIAMAMGPLMNVVSNISFVIIAAFGGYFAINGIISVGVISAFIVYAMQFSRPINSLANLYAQIETAIAGAERVFAVLDEPGEEKTGANRMLDAGGMISFRNVNFSYQPEKQVLYDFNLEVKAGQKIALVGATGSGKTTVVNLLMRFYDIDSGEILIDGVDIRSLALDDLRSNIAIVLQDTVLFSDTIRNNLKYSDPGISDDAMELAAKQSCCDRMIEQMPMKYDTVLTEEGANLSQGQRQLLSICRAFLADPRILILDEATSSVDTRTEKAIQDAMVNIMRDRTSLIIAHRLSTIQDADMIVVMDHGRIVETGRHEQLLEKQGMYYELYMTQFAGNQI